MPRKTTSPPNTADCTAETAPVTASAAPSSKLDLLKTLLLREEGASLAEMTAATLWQTHSVRGALAGALKHRGLAITSEKVNGERRYRAVAA